MARKNVPEDIIDEVMARFAAVGLIDDEAFAMALVSTRTTVSRRGGHRIRQELREKGVADEVAVEALSSVDPDEELAAATAFAARKVRSMNGLDEAVAKRRLYGALARRGFGPDVVRRVVTDVLSGPDEGWSD